MNFNLCSHCGMFMNWARQGACWHRIKALNHNSPPSVTPSSRRISITWLCSTCSWDFMKFGSLRSAMLSDMLVKHWIIFFLSGVARMCSHPRLLDDVAALDWPMGGGSPWRSAVFLFWLTRVHELTHVGFASTPKSPHFVEERWRFSLLNGILHGNNAWTLQGCWFQRNWNGRFAIV